MILKVTTCRIDSEYCSCALNGINSVIKLDCVEKKNEDFIQNLTETKEKYFDLDRHRYCYGDRTAKVMRLGPRYVSGTGTYKLA